MDAPDIRRYLEIRTAGPAGFAPDGTRVLISSDLTGTAQLYRMPRDGGELVQLTDLDEPVGGTYLPTADRLLVVTDRGGNERYQLYLMDDSGGGLEDLVVDPEVIHRPGGITRDGRLLAYASNRRNGVDFDVHVRGLDALGGAADRTVFAPGGWCGAAGFSPDGRLVAASRLTNRPGDNELHLVDRASGEAVEVAPHPDLPAVVGGPSWLPDGSAFYFSTSVGREYATVSRYAVASGEWSVALDGDWDAGCAVDWQGTHLLVSRNVDGFTRATLRDPQTLTERVQVPLPGDGVASGFRFSRDGRWLAFSFTSALVPGDAFLLDTASGELRRLTRSPCPVDPASFVSPSLERATAHDGEELPLFVYRPAASGGHRPVVVVLHGGPESQYRPSFSALTQYLVASGFAVVAPNVRGSTGYGRRFEHLDDVERRADAIRDLAAVHDWIAGTGDLDADRAALYGGSYGGYLVLAGLTFQPDRWAAGVSIVGISSLVTFLRNTAAWRRAFREREYGSLEDDLDLLEELSPANHVDRIRSPLLLVHGANDPRVPLSEAEQIHRALDGRGVRCELLVYDDEGHGLAKLHNRLDAYPRVVAFLADELDRG